MGLSILNSRYASMPQGGGASAEHLGDCHHGADLKKIWERAAREGRWGGGLPLAPQYRHARQKPVVPSGFSTNGEPARASFCWLALRSGANHAAVVFADHDRRRAWTTAARPRAYGCGISGIAPLPWRLPRVLDIDEHRATIWGCHHAGDLAAVRASEEAPYFFGGEIGCQHLIVDRCLHSRLYSETLPRCRSGSTAPPGCQTTAVGEPKISPLMLPCFAVSDIDGSPQRTNTSTRSCVARGSPPCSRQRMMCP